MHDISKELEAHLKTRGITGVRKAVNSIDPTAQPSGI